MAGHMGDQQVTVKNLKIIEVDVEAQEMLIKGALPGARKSLVYVIGSGELKFSEKAVAQPEKAVAEPVVTINEEPVVVEQKAEEEAVAAKPTEAPEKTEDKAVEAEPVAVEKPAEKEEKAEVKPGVLSDDIAKFNELPAEEQAKYSSPEIQSAISKLEEQYKANLVPVVMKLAIKELAPDRLAAYLIETVKLEAEAAEAAAKAINEQILK
jgi:hypothetical protein